MEDLNRHEWWLHTGSRGIVLGEPTLKREEKYRHVVNYCGSHFSPGSCAENLKVTVFVLWKREWSRWRNTLQFVCLRRIGKGRT